MLLGLDSKPKHFPSPKKAKYRSDVLAQFWRKRWLSGRITRPGILDQVAKYTLAYPINHGARVQLPEDPKPDLFDQNH